MPAGTRDPETYAIIGAAMEAHRQLGPGFLEAAYREALAFAFTDRGIPFAREVPFRLQFEGRVLKTHYRADYVCFGTVIVELKALSALTGGEIAQTLNYLKASGLMRGLLLNFGRESLEYRRLVLSPRNPSAASGSP
jgi:GxxExxY protein